MNGILIITVCITIGVDVLLIALEGDINTMLGKKIYNVQPVTCFINPGDGEGYRDNMNVTARPTMHFGL